MGQTLPLILLFAFLSQALAQDLHTCSMQGEHLRTYQNPLNEVWLSAYDVKHYDLSLAVSNQDTEISGEAAILLEARRNIDTVVLELQSALSVSEVRISERISPFLFNRKLSYAHEGDVLFIQLDRTRLAEELFALKVVYEGDAGQNRGFFAGINNKTDSKYGFAVTYTLSEPNNARDWFPVKQVLEDKIDSVTFRIRCDRRLLVASNGILKEIEKVGREHIITWQTHYPMAYYLLSFAVADYQDFSFMAGLSQAGDSLLIHSDQTGSASEVSPLFQVPFELELRFKNGSFQRIRLMQNRSREEFRIPVEGVVEDLIFDPDRHLLTTSHVSIEPIVKTPNN